MNIDIWSCPRSAGGGVGWGGVGGLSFLKLGVQKLWKICAVKHFFSVSNIIKLCSAEPASRYNSGK
jgi:hypothetical protein